MGSPHEGEHGAHTALLCESAVREYTERYYLPAAHAYRERIADGCAVAARIADWQHKVEQQWPALRFGEMKVETTNNGHRFIVPVYLDGLDPAFVRVQLYADGKDGGDPFFMDMVRGEHLSGVKNGYVYVVETPAGRSGSDYTPRIVPGFPALPSLWKQPESFGRGDRQAVKPNPVILPAFKSL